MSHNEKLNELLQSAASEVVILQPGAQEQASDLTDIFSQISQEIGDIAEIPDNIKDMANAIALEAKDKTILVGENETDADDALKELGSVVDSLQSMLDQIFEGGDLSNLAIDLDSEEATQEEATQDDAREIPQVSTEDLEIPEEDAPLVVDFASEGLEHIETAESALLIIDLPN